MHDDTSSGFSSDQYLKCYPDGIQFHYWNYGRNKIIRRKIISTGQRCKSILDIGCGRGVTVEYLRQHGFNCFGCDITPVKPISPEISKYIYASTDAFSLHREFYQEVDTILLLDILEHMEHPEKFLSECLMKFQNVRNILITLPARQELWSNYDEFYEHFMRYDNKSLITLLEGFNFRKVEIGHLFHLLYIFARFLSVMNSSRGVEINAPCSGIALMAHKYLAQFFSLEEKLVPRFMPGTSIYALINIR